MKTWINFDELRAALSFGDVLAGYQVEMTRKGNTQQYVGTCPLPLHRDAKGKTFSANYEKRVWQCFGCNEHGNILDFAVLMEGKDKKNGKDVRAVAMSLDERFLKKAQKITKPAPAKEKPKAKAEEMRVVINQPLDFELKTLERDHPCFAERNIAPETVAEFGLGYCRRGTLTGRIAVPLLDDARALVGYAGLLPSEKDIRPDSPKYLFPTVREHDDVKHVFERGKFLYNGHRVTKSVKDLIVVRECHSVWHLFQGGFLNVVALMGNECSDEQAGIIALATADRARIWFLTDSTPESEMAAASLLLQVTPVRLCRWVKVKHDAEIAPDHPLLAAIARR